MLRGSWIAPDAGKVTFATHAKTWLERQHQLRPRTVELYAHLLKCHILPTFGDRQLSDISPTEIIAWHGALFLKLPGTAPKAYRLVAQLMRVAVEDDRILRNPCTVKGASSEERAEQAIATVAEVEALSKAVPAKYRAMVLLAAWCSLRFGEAAALRCDRFDLLHGEVRVTETVTELLTGERFTGPPKTAAGRRTVAIPPHLLPVIEEHLSALGAAPDALLFPSPEGGFLRRQNFRQRVWAPALRTTGLSYRFHDLRHSGLTWAAASGATIAELMHRGGHSTAAAAMRYQHATKERDQTIARALSRLGSPSN